MAAAAKPVVAKNAAQSWREGRQRAQHQHHHDEAARGKDGRVPRAAVDASGNGRHGRGDDRLVDHGQEHGSMMEGKSVRNWTGVAACGAVSAGGWGGPGFNNKAFPAIGSATIMRC
ncbi:hypothetical protein [Nitratireductor sp. GCM10026969]|uniref:hypothetical protein n=1 Tax=Nitratireductor sp. GCM10026969 TaxID=3252645 RepID=UPI0036112D75